jgi:uncharacterized membrane protein YbjE (DUF340 family)
MRYRILRMSSGTKIVAALVGAVLCVQAAASWFAFFWKEPDEKERSRKNTSFAIVCVFRRQICLIICGIPITQICENRKNLQKHCKDLLLYLILVFSAGLKLRDFKTSQKGIRYWPSPTFTILYT